MSQVHEPSGRTANTTLETIYFFDCTLFISPELSMLSPFGYSYTLLFSPQILIECPIYVICPTRHETFEKRNMNKTIPNKKEFKYVSRDKHTH